MRGVAAGVVDDDGRLGGLAALAAPVPKKQRRRPSELDFFSGCRIAHLRPFSKSSLSSANAAAGNCAWHER